MVGAKTPLITIEQGGQRLDLFLAPKLNLTRSQTQKLIERGLVSLNGQIPTKTGVLVKAGNQIVVTANRQPPGDMSSHQASPATNGSASRLVTPKIIAATSDYLVVEKSTGLLTHPTQAQETNTLADWLVKKYPEIKGVGDSLPPLTKRGRGGVAEAKTFRPGIVHRLDKEASGLLVVARTQAMFDALKAQFKNRTVAKEYLALAHGRVAKDWGEIQFPIARGESGRMAARPLSSPLRGEVPRSLASWPKSGAEGRESKDGEKEARTEFLVERRFVNFTLLRVTLHTGRMHQIRVHLLAYNHPLVGDPLYYQKKRPHKWDDKLGRLFLHATKLSFTDLSGERQTFESPLPKELAEFLKILK